MIKIFVPFADRLNLNGDCANALILERRLNDAGFDSERVELGSVEELAEQTALVSEGGAPSIVVLGHGSTAAMHSIVNAKAEVIDLLESVVRSGGICLVIGSSYEWLVAHENTERISEFVEVPFDLPGQGETFSVVGYVNSSAKLENLMFANGVLYTRLHGPVLAKSPELADFMCGVVTSNKYRPKPNEALLQIIEEARAVARGERD